MFTEERVPIPDQSLVDYVSQNLKTTYEVIDNLVNEGNNFSCSYTFTNIGSKQISYGNWSVFFHSIRLVQPNDFPYPDGYLLTGCNMRVFHIAGTLFRLFPVKTFSLNPSESITCFVYSKYWEVARTDSMPNWYIGAEGMGAKTIASTTGNDLSFVKPFVREGQVKRYPSDTYGFYLPHTRFLYNSDVNDTGKVGNPVIPTPVEILLDEGQTNFIDPGSWVVVNSNDFPRTTQYFAGILPFDIRKR